MDGVSQIDYLRMVIGWLIMGWKDEQDRDRYEDTNIYQLSIVCSLMVQLIRKGKTEWASWLIK